MNKKLIIPIALGVIIFIFILSRIIGPGNKITLSYDDFKESVSTPDTIILKVYVENSGSMDAYMCQGSNLKDAVYDFISDLKKHTDECSLYYINSKIIPCNVTLDTYIKNLTPSSFAKAGGNRANTDLREIFRNVLINQTPNTVSVLISDCILDIPESATNFFGNCQVSIKNSFNEALIRNPNLGVQIIKMKSKFDGYWFCGKNKAHLSNVERPYYIWVIGDKYILKEIKQKVSISEDYGGGVQNYCAYSTKQPIEFFIEKTRYVVNHSGKISIDILADLSATLQDELTIQSLNQYDTPNSSQVLLTSVSPITTKDSKYSHVLNVEITNPQVINNAIINMSYPYLPKWVEETNDNTGKDIENNLDKTTGLLYLVKGVAEAYKEHTNYGSIEFQLKNK